MDNDQTDIDNGMAAYELSAPRYDEKDQYPPSSKSMTAVEEIVVWSLLRNIQYQDVLDAATGTGRYALCLAQMRKHIVGIDTSRQLLARAREKADELQLDIAFRLASVLAVPEPDESFDLVICALALAHVKDLAGAIQELVRVLRRGGHLVITDVHPTIQKAWGPDYTALVCDGRLLISNCEKEAQRVRDADSMAVEVPFPNYHGDLTKYLDSVEKAGADLLAAIDVPMEQWAGLLPGALVVFARKRGGG